MIHTALWTCALLALAGARTYERCELARELQELGVHQDHLSTWVCIAYHESRFDTSAQNYYSGDHGLFQISELFWCGAGKACGLPCSALRDEDISDDFECALQIHEEHTRLQGDGFLAWVVYPQHCKHNTKKYIVDCDSHLKDLPVRTESRSRMFNNRFIKNVTYTNKLDVDNLKPPYLTVNSLLRGEYGKKVIEKDTRVNWLNYKIDNIDDLSLPVFDNKFDEASRLTTTKPTSPRTTTTTTTTTTTSTTTAYPPIKVWRRIETNQFRKKANSIDDNKKPHDPKWFEYGKTRTYSDNVTPSGVDNSKLTHDTQPAPRTFLPELTTQSSTFRASSPITARAPSQSVISTSSAPALIRTTTKSPFPAFTFTTKRPTTNRNIVSTYAKPAPARIRTTRPYFLTTTTVKPSTVKVTTDIPGTKSKTFVPFAFTTAMPLTKTTTNKPTIEIHKPVTNFTVRPDIARTNSRSAVRRIEQKTMTTKWPERRNSYSFYQSTTTKNPTLFDSSKISTTASTYTKTSTTTKRPIRELSSSLNSFRSFRNSRVLQQNTSNLHITNKPLRNEFSTKLPTTTPTSISKIQTQRAPIEKTTQSVFDVYLSPTQWPKLRTYKFPEFSNSSFKLKIFSGGTTTPIPQSSSRKTSPPLGGILRNHLKRQT